MLSRASLFELEPRQIQASKLMATRRLVSLESGVSFEVAQLSVALYTPQALVHISCTGIYVVLTQGGPDWVG
jgi:hypothetical protein